MSKRKMFQCAISLTLLIALLGGGMGVWAEASNQEPIPEERDWEPTPWPYPIPPTGTRYCEPVNVPPQGLTVGGGFGTLEGDEPTPLPAPLPTGTPYCPPQELTPAEPSDGGGVKTQEVPEETVPAGD